MRSEDTRKFQTFFPLLCGVVANASVLRLHDWVFKSKQLQLRLS